MIYSRGLYQWLLYSCWQPTLALTPFMKLQILIYPIHLLVVPAFTHPSYVSKQLPEAIGWMFKGKLLQHVNNLTVILAAGMVILATR